MSNRALPLKRLRMLLFAGWLTLLLLPARRANASAADQVLEASGWSQERRETVYRGDSLTKGDASELLAIAQRLRRFRDKLLAEAQGSLDGPFALALVEGRVTETAVQAEDQPPTLLCRFQHAEETTSVLCDAIPTAWRNGAPMPQPAELLALRVRPDLLVAIHWRWAPAEASYPHVNFGQSVLGGLGVDVALLDQVRDGGPLRSQESAPFYELLTAMRGIGANQLARFAKGNLPRYAQQWSEDAVGEKARPMLAAEARRMISEDRYPIAPLFNDAVKQRGELYVVDGVARRCVAIEVAAAAGNAPSVARSFGVDRYYELEVFTPDSYNLPLVFCMLEIPEGFPVGDNLTQPVRVAGFSFKRWAYLTRQATGTGGDKAQLAPLLIGRAPILLAPPESSGPAQGLIVGGAFAGALGLVWWVVWRTAQKDAQFEAAARRMKAEPIDPHELASLAALDQGSRRSSQGNPDP